MQKNETNEYLQIAHPDETLQNVASHQGLRYLPGYGGQYLNLYKSRSLSLRQ